VSCSDVCLSMDYDNHNEFFSARTLKARRPHRCVECGAAIKPGEHYRKESGKSDGRLWSESTCAICIEIREAFVCGCFVFGELYEAIQDEMFPIWTERGPIECLAKLETREARDEMRRRYGEWKEGA